MARNSKLPKAIDFRARIGNRPGEHSAKMR